MLPLNRLLSNAFGVVLIKQEQLTRITSECAALGIKSDSLSAEIEKLQQEKAQLLNTASIQAQELSIMREKEGNFQVLPLSNADERLSYLGSLLCVKEVVGFEKRRIGGPADGGYVCIDDFTNIDAAISVGIGGDVSWDTEVANRGLPVFQYDHTVSDSPEHHPNFVFQKRRLAVTEGPGTVTLDKLSPTERPVTDASIFGKIDIEGDEWQIFSSATAGNLQQFAQLVCEFHWFENILHDEFFRTAARALENLRAVFEPVHVHANNYSNLLVAGTVLFPNVLEVTFVNKSRYSCQPYAGRFPTNSDSANRPDRDDYHLGRFEFPCFTVTSDGV